MSHATCSFYDDIRYEVTGKVTRIGEYQADIRVNELPTEIHQFWVQVKYATEVGEPDYPMSVSVELPGNEEPITIDLGGDRRPEKSVDPDTQFYVSVIDIPFRPLRLTEEGYIKVYVRTASGEEYRAGRLKVVDLSTAQEGEGREFLVPLHVLGACVAHFGQLMNEGCDKDASEFASKTLRLVRETMPQSVANEILSSGQGRIAINPKRAWVIFETPQKNTPEVSLHMPGDAPKASIESIDRFGFELLFDEPFMDLGKIDYAIK